MCLKSELQWLKFVSVDNVFAWSLLAEGKRWGGGDGVKVDAERAELDGPPKSCLGSGSHVARHVSCAHLSGGYAWLCRWVWRRYMVFLLWYAFARMDGCSEDWCLFRCRTHSQLLRTINFVISWSLTQRGMHNNAQFHLYYKLVITIQGDVWVMYLKEDIP